MTTGVVVSLADPKRQGGTLAAGTLAGHTSLIVDDALDFDERFDVPRFLVIGEETTPREYVAVQNDPAAVQTVQLAAAVGAVFEAGEPVTLWDPDAAASDKRAITYRLRVLLDGQPSTAGPIPAAIPHDLVPASGLATLVGASVEVEKNVHGEPEIVHVYGRDPLIGQTFIGSAAYSVTLAADETIPHDVETTLTGWVGGDGTRGEGTSSGGTFKGDGTEFTLT